MPLILPDSREVPCNIQDSTTVTIEALRGLNADTLVHEIKRLRDSVDRLHDSNRQIEQFVHETGSELSENDRQEMKNACSDNQGTIARQADVVDKLFSVLDEKVSQAEIEKYYGLQRPSVKKAGSLDAMQEDQDGVFL